MTGSAAAPSGLVAPLTGVALVTGAASGIGAETVKSFSRAGVRRFALCDVQTDALKQLVASLGPDHDVLTAAVDVADAAQVNAFVDDVVARFGRLDYAANCAGIAAGSASFGEFEDEMYDKVISINQRGVYLCMKAELRVMAKQSLLEGPDGDLRKQRGAIVNIASLAGFVGIPRSPAYTASKHAVMGFTKSACGEYASQKVRINAVAPGWIMTPMTAHVHTAFGVDSLDDVPRVPAKRAGRPQEVADVIVFLASENASYVNGATWQIDGGLLASG